MSGGRARRSGWIAARSAIAAGGPTTAPSGPGFANLPLSAGALRAGCWQCHGTIGQGAATGPKLTPDPLPFDALSSFVRTTNREMPAYREEVLSDADLADLYAYLKSIPKNHDPKTIPLLSR